MGNTGKEDDPELLKPDNSGDPSDRDSEEDEANTEESLSEAVETPATTVEKLQAETQELNDRLLRTIADFDNFKKRSRQQQEDKLKYGNERLIADLLPIIDNFERALASQEENGDINSWKTGVELIARQLVEILERYGVRPIQSLNTPFDPNRHDAVGQVTTEKVPEGHVIEEMQRGYMLHDRVVRPARVRVAARPDAAEEAPETHPEYA